MDDDKLQRLIAKRKAIDAQIQQHQRRQNKAARRIDAHKKILVGATALDLASKDGEFSARLDAGLKSFITKPKDRALLGLPPLPAK